MAEQMRALGYLCPECGKIVYGERTRFAMSAAAVGLVCGCGRSELTAQPEGASCRLTVPCGLCGGEHRAEAVAERLLETQVMEPCFLVLPVPRPGSCAAISASPSGWSVPCGSWS